MVAIIAANTMMKRTSKQYEQGHEQGHESSFQSKPPRSSQCLRGTHGAMGRRIDPSWGGPIELFLAPASAPRLL